MRYMLLIGSDDKTQNQAPPPKAQMDAIIQGHMRFADELRAEGQDGRARIACGRRPTPAASASRPGQHQVMDGPFAETKEALGGFYLIECDSREEAVEWAKKIPLGEGGFVDVRPVWPM